jgi:2-(1,2-epoxy-1,2-dihydrophenyl)acetyl-CoA isomerase
MTAFEFLEIEQSEGVLLARLNRPKANAFHNAMIEEWLQVLKQAAGDPAVRCLLLTGAGRFFCAGQDVSALGQDGGQVSFRLHLQRTYNRVILRMRQLEKPILAAVNGPAVGAGLGLALAADLRLAAESASFIYGFTGIGLTADSATSLMLPLLIGLGRASEVAFTNRPIPAEQALAWGLVNRVVPDEALLTEAQALAAELAAGPTRALGLSKRAFNRNVLGDLEAVLDYEAYLQELAGRTEDHRSSLAAFLEKRQPEFHGR